MTDEQYEKLFKRIKEDVYIEDYTAIAELISNVPEAQKLSYISEEQEIKEFKVRIEVKTESIDLAEVTVFAMDRQDALKQAKQAYDDDVELDYWASDHRESELDVDSMDNWEVEEV